MPKGFYHSGRSTTGRRCRCDCHDPDGTGVELQVDAFPTKEAAAAYFDSDAFRDNPIGVLFDPEELVKAFEAGVPEEELMRRPVGKAEGSVAARR